MRQLALIAALVVLAVAVAGCARQAGVGGADGNPSHSVPPTGGATGGPAPLPDVSTPTIPSLPPITPVPGTRERSVQWKLVGQDGPVLFLEVAIGGPPCDTVTAVNVVEAADAVTVTVYAGATERATCSPGVRAILGTARVEARLSQPLGSRRLLPGA